MDAASVRLGRRAVRHAPARKLLGHQLLSLLPSAPAAVDNTKDVSQFGMMVNDRLGDCTCAGIAHSLQIATLVTGVEYTPSDADVLDLYEKACGWSPADPTSDRGGVEVDVLSYVQASGFSGHKLLGWVSLDARDSARVRQATAWFGSVYVGAEMPLEAQDSGEWAVVGGERGVAGGWGGHCMVSPAYDESSSTYVTWGRLQRATAAWDAAYVDEAHALLWDVWVDRFPGDTREQVLALLASLQD